jgi:hypothetical protein
MRKPASLCLLLLTGCASAGTPEPEPTPRSSVIRLAPGIASITIPDSAKWVPVQGARFRIVNGPCDTGDPMPVAKAGEFSVTPAMPNAPTLQPIPYIPNACPVTAGPLASQSMPAVLQRGEKRLRTPHEQP